MDFKKIIKYIASFAIAGVLLYFSFRDVKWDDFWLALKACRWEFVILSMFFGLMSFFLRSLRWRMLLLPIDPSIKIMTSFNAVNVSYVVNLILPRVGELVRCGIITRNSRKGEDGKKLAGIDKVIGTAIADRLWDGLTLVILLILLMLLMWKQFGGFFYDKIVAPLSQNTSFDFTLLIGLVIALIVALVFVCFKFKDRLPFLKKITDAIAGVGQGLATSFKMKNSWLFVVYTVLVWLMYLLMSASIIWALQGLDLKSVSPEVSMAFSKIQSLTIVDAFFLMIVGGISSLVPVPGGFGAFHYLVSIALSSVYGIPASVGIIFATLSHESQTIIQIISGGLSYMYEVTFSKRK